MDRPGALAVKLNTRDRKGSGAHPGYGLKLSPATDRGPASRCHRWDTRIHPRAARVWPQAPRLSVTPAPAWGCPQLGGYRQRRALALEQLPLFQSSGADLREHLERPWGRAVRRAASWGPRGSQPRGSSSRQWSVQEELQQSFQWCGHPQADGGESFWSFSVQDLCDALVSTSRPADRQRHHGQ